MSTSADQADTTADTQDSIFGRVLVGIDDSPESVEAARQAAILATGPITLLAAYDLTQTVVGAGMPPAPVIPLDEGPLREGAEKALGHARQALGTKESAGKIAQGRAWEVLLDEIADERITLVAVGSHGAGRAKGILIGSTATELVHKAPCSVLVARKPLKRFPGSIVVGLDGSKEAALADVVAGALAERFGAQLERLENLPHP
jgi:nucleotide-binding universal stress UspA family protein